MFLKVSHWHWGLICCCTGTITCLEFYGSSHLLSGGEDGLLCVWNTKKWQCLKSIKAHKYADQGATKTEVVVLVVFLDEETWTQLSSFVSQRLGDVAVCPSFWQTRTYSWGGPNSQVALRHFEVKFWPQIELRSSTINTDYWAFSTCRTWNLINGRSAFIKNIKQSEPRHNTKVSEPWNITNPYTNLFFFFRCTYCQMVSRWGQLCSRD